MTIPPKQPESTPRDGTSQAGRVLHALLPGYVSVDERTVEDLVAFAREYGKGLTYFGADGQPSGDFGAFIGSLDLASVAAFLQAPESFDPASFPQLYRPHFVLFLAFLKLYQSTQQGLNTLTQRHLDFYYRQVLRLLNKGPTPDRLNLVFVPTANATQVMVPGGSLLAAGVDSLGRERYYATERDLVVNRAQLKKVSSLYVERRLVGFAEARALNARYTTDVGMAMLQLAIGHPQPGDPLPAYPDAPGIAVDFAKLTQLDQLVQLTGPDRGFFLSLSEIASLLSWKQLAATLPAAEQDDRWRAINHLLEQAGQRKRSDPGYHFPPEGTAGFALRDFDVNLAAAIGPVTQAGLGTLTVPTYWTAIQTLESYVFMTADNFHTVMKVITAPDGKSWVDVDRILEEAHRKKVTAVRRSRLVQIHSMPATSSLAPLIHEVMGNDSATATDLVPYLQQDSQQKLDRILASSQAIDWNQVFDILVEAQNNRSGIPPAQQEQWLNLYPAADAAVTGTRPTLAQKGSTPRWATFGVPQPAAKDTPPAPVLGWALSSPLLGLSEGTRVITLTLCFRPEQTDKLKDLFSDPNKPCPLSFAVSTKKGWVECQPDSASVDSYAKLYSTNTSAFIDPATANAYDPVCLRCKLTLPASVDPLVPLPVGVGALDSPSPLLRLMLRPLWSETDGAYMVRYRELGTLLLVAVDLKVEVSGLRNLSLQSDEGTLNPRKPYEPFGSAPSVGSRLLIGHPEVVTRKLDSLRFNFQWMGAPADLAAHYANYVPNGALALPFTAKISLFDRSIISSLSAKASLFASPTSAQTTIALGGPLGDELIFDQGFPQDVSTWPRYLQWELNDPDFQHHSYPALAAASALKLACDISKGSVSTDTSIYQLKPPYTPKLKSLTLDYSCSQEVRLDAPQQMGPAMRLLHLHPFGTCDVAAERTAAGVPFLPRYENDGELYLGLQGVAAPQSVCILFQLAEGSADPDLTPQPVTWSYLDGDVWMPVAQRLIRDTTRGFINSGILEFALDPVAPSTRMDGSLYWLRAAIAQDPASICDTIAIHTQAVSATFVNRNNAADHFRIPLPGGTITKLATKIPGIAGVLQPYTSFAGRMAEDDGMWATRVSERLRHKQRALSIWDYERIVLARFPEIYKAKCIPAGPDAPGQVDVIVIPDIRNIHPSDPFEPKAPVNLLADVQSYLASKVPAFVSVRVRNAAYIAVCVRLYVRFTQDGNESYYIQQLNDELNRFLSPWAYDEGADIVLGGKLYANSIIDFVDRRPYVDYVAGVKLFSSVDGENFVPASTGTDDSVGTGRPDTVLVATRTHMIHVLHDALYEEKLETGINFMSLELDFIVGP